MSPFARLDRWRAALPEGAWARVDVRDGDAVRHVPAALTVFRIGDDGRLTFVRKYDVETGGGKFQWWTGFVQPA